jgi:hypothetical protein
MQRKRLITTAAALALLLGVTSHASALTIPPVHQPTIKAVILPYLQTLGQLRSALTGNARPLPLPMPSLPAGIARIPARF